jgi:hypothetical protein
MPNVIATHAVGNMEMWLAGGEERAALFKTFCASYRIYRHSDQPKVSIVWENVDMAKFEAVLSHPDAAKAEAKNTVIRPIDVYVEILDGS